MLGEWKSVGCTVEIADKRGFVQVGEVFAQLDYSLALRLSAPAGFLVGDEVAVHLWNEAGNLKILTGEILQAHGSFLVVAIVLRSPLNLESGAAASQPERAAGRSAKAVYFAPPALPAADRREGRFHPRSQRPPASRVDHWIGKRVATHL